MDKQQQKAGNASLAIQAGGDVTVGISAADALAITQHEIARVLGELSEQARHKAEQRTSSFAGRMRETFGEDVELMQAYADPDFQFSLQDAARSVASSGDAHTEDLLVELLANRARAGNTSAARLATGQAVRIADKLSLEALNGLTILWVLSRLRSTAPFGEVQYAIARAQIIRDSIGLPAGGNWRRELDALGLVQITPAGIATRNPLRTIISTRTQELLVSGVAREDFDSFVSAAGVDLSWIVGAVAEHPFKPGYVILLGSSAEQFGDRVPDEARGAPGLEELIVANGFGATDESATAERDRQLDADPAFAEVATWWDEQPALELSLVGEVIAFVNAGRYFTWEGERTVQGFLKELP